MIPINSPNDPILLLERANLGSGIRIRAHPTALIPLWRRLQYRRGRDRKRFGNLIIRLHSDYLDIQNSENLLAPMEEIFQ